MKEIEKVENKIREYVIHFKNGEKLSLLPVTVKEFGLREGQKLKETQIESIKRFNWRQLAENHIGRLLSVRMRTEKEIRERLKYTKIPKDIINEVIKNYKRLGLIDDRKFAELYFEEKREEMGKNRIKFELLKRGISEKIIEDVLNANNNEEEKELAERLAKRWLEKNKDLPKEVKKRRLFAYLSRRGIKPATINSLNLRWD